MLHGSHTQSAHGQALDLKRRNCSKLRGYGQARKRRMVKLTKLRFSRSSIAWARAGLPVDCSLRVAQSCALRTTLILSSSWASGPEATRRRASCSVKAARAAPRYLSVAQAPAPLGGDISELAISLSPDISELAISLSPDIFQDCGGEGKV